MVKGFVNYTYTAGLILGYGQVPEATHARLEDVRFITNQNGFAFMIQATLAYGTGRGTPYSLMPGMHGRGPMPNRPAPSTIVGLDDLRVVNSTFESDGDGGDVPVTNVVFENCTFSKADRPGKLAGKNVGPIVIKREDERSRRSPGSEG